MKLYHDGLARWLSRRPANIRAILVYGPDQGHVAETADMIATSVVEDVNDPFCVVELTAETVRADPAALPDATAALSLTGGDRLVRLRGATNAIAGPLTDLAASHAVEAFTLVEAGIIEARSKLRKLFETSPVLATIACYGDEGRGLDTFIRTTLEAHQVRADSDALAFLGAHLGGDRRQTRSELDKLALMIGPGGTAGLDAVAEAIGDGGALALDDIAYAVAGGDGRKLEQALRRAEANDEAPVRILRIVIGHFQKLYQIAIMVAAGEPRDRAIGSLRPPVFRNRIASFQKQLGLWSPPRLEAALARLLEAESQCKSTGFPDRALCAQTLIGLCLARSNRRKRAG